MGQTIQPGSFSALCDIGPVHYAFRYQLGWKSQEGLTHMFGFPPYWPLSLFTGCFMIQ